MRLRRWRGWAMWLVALTTVAGMVPAAPTAAITPPELTRAMQATVRLWPLDARNQPLASCSGVVLDPSGVIATSWRCLGVAPDVGADASGQGLPAGSLFHPQGWVQIGVATPGQAAQPTFLAEYRGGSAQDDVAIVQVVGLANGEAALPPTLGLVAAATAERGSVQLGDAVHLLGFGTGIDEAVGVTEATVSDYVGAGGSREVGGFRFDAATPSGYAGGSTVDDFGRLVGIGTSPGAAGSVDRSILADIVLAYANLPASQGTVPESALSAGTPFGPISFGTSVVNNQLVGTATAFPTGTKEVHGLFTYQGMANGTHAGRVWRLNGQVVIDKRDAEVWDGGTEGVSERWVSNDNGLDTGKWELTLYVGGQEVRSGSFTIGLAGGDQGGEGAPAAFGPIHFGTAIQNGKLIGEATAFPSGTKHVEGQFAASGMRDGMRWGTIWYYNGQIDVDRRNASVWQGNGPGVGWSAYTSNADTGFDDGTYELELYLNNQAVQRAAFTVGGRPGGTATPAPVSTTVSGGGSTVGTSTVTAAGTPAGQGTATATATGSPVAQGTPASGATPPNPPTNVTASIRDASSISLFWVAPTTGQPNYYQLFQSANGGPYTSAGYAQGNLTSVYVANLTAGSSYNFYVVAVSNNLSSPPSNTAGPIVLTGSASPTATGGAAATVSPSPGASATVSPSPGAAGALAPPTNVMAAAQDATTISLTWGAPTTGQPPGYQIFQSVNGGAFASAGYVQPAPARVQLANLVAGSYSYYMVSVDGPASGPPSNVTPPVVLR